MIRSARALSAIVACAGASLGTGPVAAIAINPIAPGVQGTLFTANDVAPIVVDGDNMTGMLLTVEGSDASGAAFTDSAVAWSADPTGSGAGAATDGFGGATGSGWGIFVTGDTFGTSTAFAWTIELDAGVTLNRILFDGLPGDIVFDRGDEDPTIHPFSYNFVGDPEDFGTTNSFRGQDFEFDFNNQTGIAPSNILAIDANSSASYFDPVSTLVHGGGSPVGDLFGRLEVLLDDGLGASGVTNIAMGSSLIIPFALETDLIVRQEGPTGVAAPEPETITLLFLALVGLSTHRRRRRE